MRTTTGDIQDGAVTHPKLSAALLQGKSVFERFDHQPLLALPGGFGDPTGTTGQINEATFRSGLYAQYSQLGAGETITGPVFDYTTGLLDISEDQTATEGVHYDWGGNSPRNPYLFTVGTSPSYSWRWKFKIEDASGIGGLVIGLRKQAALAADWNDYTDLAALNIVQGVINISTILNNAATATVDTTLVDVADAETIEFEIQVRGRRCFFYYAGARVGLEPLFDFDSTDVVIPFTDYLHGTDVSKLYPTELEFAPIRDLQSNP